MVHERPTLLETGQVQVVLGEYDESPHRLVEVGRLPEERQRAVLDKQDAFDLVQLLDDNYSILSSQNFSPSRLHREPQMLKSHLVHRWPKIPTQAHTA
jgi:hypothetical protein